MSGSKARDERAKARWRSTATPGSDSTSGYVTKKAVAPEASPGGASHQVAAQSLLSTTEQAIGSETSRSTSGAGTGSQVDSGTKRSASNGTNALALAIRNQPMKTAIEVYSMYEGVGGDGGDPSDADRMLGAPSTTLDKWLSER